MRIGVPAGPGTIELRSLADRVEIAHGVWMPRLGMGTSQAYDADVRREVGAGLEIGYRLIDTAANYLNEAEIGQELARSGLPREDVFVTTKLEEPDFGYRSTFEALEGSLARLGLEYVDLYLIHWPAPALVQESWRAMEELHRAGRVRAIGVSNFEPEDIDAILESARVAPAVNQFELHPLRQRRRLRDHCRARGITVQAWAPVLRGHAAEVAELDAIARRHGKTPAQVSIRWLLQQGVTTIPKSVHAERLRENAEVFDFELTHEEMAAIDALDRGLHVR